PLCHDPGKRHDLAEHGDSADDGCRFVVARRTKLAGAAAGCAGCCRTATGHAGSQRCEGEPMKPDMPAAAKRRSRAGARRQRGVAFLIVIWVIAMVSILL